MIDELQRVISAWITSVDPVPDDAALATKVTEIQTVVTEASEVDGPAILDVISFFECQLQLDLSNISQSKMDVAELPSEHTEEGQSLRDQWNQLVRLLNALLLADVFTASLARTLLDTEILAAAGLILEPKFSKQVVRINTGRLYKQKKFNLLREESEGFSKIILETVDMIMSSEDHDDLDALAAEANLKIQSIIGYFNLDPNRTLDILLDVLTVNIVSHCDFIMKILKHTPWWPQNVPLKAPKIFPDDWFENLKACPGNAVATQMLGFKYGYFDSHSRTPPQEFIYGTAVFIKEGIVNLLDLYPYLNPSDEECREELKIWKKNMDDKADKAKSNALSMAAPLSDEKKSIIAGSVDGEAKENGSVVPRAQRFNQKAHLVEALIAIGDIGSAAYLLSNFPWLCGPRPELADLLMLLIHHSINPLYEPLQPIPSEIQKLVHTPRMTPEDPLDINSRIISSHQKSTVKTLNRLRKQSGLIKYEFFYEPWRIGIPLVHTVDEFFNCTYKLVNFVGVRLGRDPSLLTKICRIAVSDLQKVR